MLDMQKIVDAMGEAGRLQRSNYHLTLGALIKALAVANPDALVIFDTGGAPSSPHSYRGYYSDLAFETSGERMTAAHLLDTCRNALGVSFEGYKGGDFVMKENTPLWSASYGSCGRAIVAASPETNGWIRLTTKEIE